MKRMMMVVLLIVLCPFWAKAVLAESSEENKDNEEKIWEIGVGAGYYIPLFVLVNGGAVVTHRPNPSTINLNLKINPRGTKWGFGLDFDYFQRWEAYYENSRVLFSGKEIGKTTDTFKASGMMILFIIQRETHKKIASGFFGIGGGILRLNLEHTREKNYDFSIGEYKQEHSFASDNTQKNVPVVLLKAGFDYLIFGGLAIGAEIKCYLIFRCIQLTNGPAGETTLDWVVSGPSPILNLKYRF